MQLSFATKYFIWYNEHNHYFDCIVLFENKLHISHYSATAWQSKGKRVVEIKILVCDKKNVLGCSQFF